MVKVQQLTTETVLTDNRVRVDHEDNTRPTAKGKRGQVRFWLFVSASSIRCIVVSGRTKATLKPAVKPRGDARVNGETIRRAWRRSEIFFTARSKRFIISPRFRLIWPQETGFMRNKRSPLKDRPLRNPGQSLDEQIRDLTYDGIAWPLLFAMF